MSLHFVLVDPATLAGKPWAYADDGGERYFLLPRDAGEIVLDDETVCQLMRKETSAILSLVS